MTEYEKRMRDYVLGPMKAQRRVEITELKQLQNGILGSWITVGTGKFMMQDCPVTSVLGDEKKP